MIDLFFPPNPPEPKNVSIIHDMMKNECRDYRSTPEQKREKRLKQMRDYAKNGSVRNSLREGFGTRVSPKVLKSSNE